MKTENIVFHNDRGDLLSGRMYSPAEDSRGTVIFCHGLFSSKDAYKIVNLAADITGTGFTLLTFDFSFVSGIPESFKKFSILREIRDLESAVAFLRARGASHLHLVGSSMGGVVALLYAASLPEDLRSLTLIATPVDLGGLLDTLSGGLDLTGLPEDGYTIVDGIPIGNGFFREARALDMISTVRSVSVPTLVIHGAEDRVVNVRNAGILRDVLAVERKVVVVPDGDHNLTREGDLRLLRDEIPSWISSHADPGRKRVESR